MTAQPLSNALSFYEKNCAFNSLDPLHLAAACIGKANFLLTCDDEILGNAACIESIAANKRYELKVRDPIIYMQENWRVK
jgi:hypothetical protein